MKKMNDENLKSLSGGTKEIAACFGAGLLAAIAIANWWNPVGIMATEGTLVTGGICLAS